MSEIYIGVMSGTSQDGLDCVAVEFDERNLNVVGWESLPFPDGLRLNLAALAQNEAMRPAEFGALDDALGDAIADAVDSLMRSASLNRSDITAIGSHGHTVYHQPPQGDQRGFTLQFGNPNVIAARTNIKTVADIRRLDMAFGGHGAPLAPAFHEWLWRDQTICRGVLNLGGIANITVLRPGHPTQGFDTGPANTLIDQWSLKQRGQPFDDRGAWAKSGGLLDDVLTAWVEEPYFSQAPPKSTGREHFNLHWMAQRAGEAELGQSDPADVARTLVELTASTVHASVSGVDIKELIVCGGGAHNDFLLERIGSYFVAAEVVSSAERGLHPDRVEATAFAWLAKQRLEGHPGNLPSVTGARQACLLGAVYCPS